jgi:dipeptidyl aminopeptidase/acylaminoacyl peptidase
VVWRDGHGLTDGLIGWGPAFGPMGRTVAILLVLALLAGMLAVIALLASRPEPGPLTLNGLVAFVGNPPSSRWLTDDIYLVNQDGSGLRQLTDTDQPEYSPAFSPDGSRLAYLRGERNCKPRSRHSKRSNRPRRSRVGTQNRQLSG